MGTAGIIREDGPAGSQGRRSGEINSALEPEIEEDDDDDRKKTDDGGALCGTFPQCLNNWHYISRKTLSAA